MKRDLQRFWVPLCCLFMAMGMSVLGCDDDDEKDKDTETTTQTDTGTETETETETETQDTQTGTDTETATETGTEDTESITETGTGTETQDTGTGTDTETVTEDTGTGTGTETDTGTETVSTVNDLWGTSGHADTSAEAFNHWNEPEGTDTEPLIPTSCAKCHSTTGYRDYLGDDGSLAGVVDVPVSPGEVVTCAACHNDAAAALDSVTFPSGVTIEDLGSEAICMTCHQGTTSTEAVNDATLGLGMDEVSNIGFVNIHYYAAGATKYGRLVRGAYQYDEKAYQGFWDHVSIAASCTSCHNPHSLEIDPGVCTTCHSNVESTEDFDEIRATGSVPDYDGDGNTEEGIAQEIEGLKGLLYTQIQTYANDTTGAEAIIYDPGSYPYFFIDTNENGQVDDGEANFGNRYNTWTPRLLKAAYNYQYGQKDTGAFAHNAKYVIQVLYDSVEDLGGDVSGLYRNDFNHFNGASETFRHWDEDDPPLVSNRCARCHSHAGFVEYASTGSDPTEAVEPSDGLLCETCHDFASPGLLVVIDSVTFPGGVQIDNDPVDPSPSFICMSCHQGRSSGDDVQADIDAEELGFVNPHYAASGATLYGADASVGFEYEGKDYTGQFTHDGASNDCTFCHNVSAEKHSFEPVLTACACHSGVDTVEDIRINRDFDYDGDGDDTEPLVDEIAGLRAKLLAAIEDYAGTQGNPIVYNPEVYPYWFKDENENGAHDEGEESYGGDPDQGEENHWNGPLMKASFNFQLAATEHGAWAHNTNYIAQLIYDSIEDLGGSLTGLERPTP